MCWSPITPSAKSKWGQSLIFRPFFRCCVVLRWIGRPRLSHAWPGSEGVAVRGGSTGSPASFQASKPPMTSVAVSKPRSWRRRAAKLDEYPWAHISMRSEPRSPTAGCRDSESESTRHSSTLSEIGRAPGIAPCSPRWSSERVSMSKAPERATGLTQKVVDAPSPHGSTQSMSCCDPPEGLSVSSIQSP